MEACAGKFTRAALEIRDALKGVRQTQDFSLAAKQVDRFLVVRKGQIDLLQASPYIAQAAEVGRQPGAIAPAAIELDGARVALFGRLTFSLPATAFRQGSPAGHAPDPANRAL